LHLFILLGFRHPQHPEEAGRQQVDPAGNEEHGAEIQSIRQQAANQRRKENGQVRQQRIQCDKTGAGARPA
jgi:hypothetical protein